MTLPASSMLGATARKVSSEVFLLLGRLPMPAIGRHRIGRPRPMLRLGRARRCGQRERRRACPAGAPAWRGSMGSMPGGQVLFLPRDSSGGAIPRKRPEIHSRPDLVHATERALVSSGPLLFYRRDKGSVGGAMRDLLGGLLLSGEPGGSLVMEAS